MLIIAQYRRGPTRRELSVARPESGGAKDVIRKFVQVPSFPLDFCTIERTN